MKYKALYVRTKNAAVSALSPIFVPEREGEDGDNEFYLWFQSPVMAININFFPRDRVANFVLYELIDGKVVEFAKTEPNSRKVRIEEFYSSIQKMNKQDRVTFCRKFERFNIKYYKDFEDYANKYTELLIECAGDLKEARADVFDFLSSR